MFPIDPSPKIDLSPEKYFKKFVGNRGVEDALQRLDKSTQEEARITAAEALKITRGIDDNVRDVDENVKGVDERVKSIDRKVEGIDDEVESVDNNVRGVSDGAPVNVNPVLRDSEATLTIAGETSMVPSQVRKRITSIC